VFKKLLIANRGEVAVRIARAARSLDVASVCAVSSADRSARWAREMDEIVCLGPPAARDSYLQRERVLQAAVQTGCGALHPGWGFLAEDPLLARMCAQFGVTFVGPPPGVMRTLGRKSPARAAMRASGLAGIPGSEALLEGVQDAVRCAEEIGYPVILKADAGGGGRGMRRADDAEQLRAAYSAAAAEASAAFGDGGLYLERYLEGGRHIEVQILADAFGTALHLFERECSVQRKHQKLIEESPSPALSDGERQQLGARAADATRAIGYIGAGTIEFLRAPEGGDYGGELFFMEMNTRLQVEHPVTECVTGIDIVRAQLEIAANIPLRYAQGDVVLDGHAIECRINAEDPSRGFRPTPGRLTAFEIPIELGPGRVRVDTHLSEGEEISSHYDSGVAKVIAHAGTRDEAIETMLRGLRAARVEGIASTIPLAIAVLESPEFRSGRYDTRAIPGWPQ
jgi:acetyl-CoA carboxylase biotin carboxylase subunit